MVILARIVALGFLVFYGLPSFATEVDHYASDDGFTQFNLPFDFELYGQSFNTANMYTNGVVQFGDQGYNHFCCHGEEYGGTGWYQQSYDISYSIMPLWTDLISNYSDLTAFNANTRQYTENNGTSFTFGWDNVYEYYRNSNNTFAVTIDDTGSWYVEYDAVDILTHNVTVGSVGDYSAQEWDQYTYRTDWPGTTTTLSDVNGYTGYITEQQEEESTTIVQQFTSDGICDYSAIEDPDCTTATETFTSEESFVVTNQSGADDGSIIDDGQDDGSTINTFTTVATEPIIVYQEDYSNTSGTTIASDGQDSGDTLGDTGEAASEQSQEVYVESSTQNESNVVYMENEPSQEQSGGMVVEEVMVPESQVTTITPTLSIDPNAALNADSAFTSKQRTSSFRRSVNSRAVAHLNAVGGLPTIGATSAEQYQAMTSSGSTVNGILVNQAMVNDPSRMYAPANPNNPTGTGMMVADASGSMNNNAFDPNQTGMYGVPDSVDNQALSGMIVATESPMGNEIELNESLSTDDLGGLNINDFNQPKLADQSNWYSDQNSLEQKSIYNNQQFYKQQEIYTGVNWYGNN